VWLEVGTDIEHAHATAATATTIADSTGDPYLSAISRLALAVVLIQHDGVRDAFPVLDACRVLLSPDDRWDTGASWVVTAHAAVLLGDTVTASAACSHAEQLVRPLGDDWGLNHLEALLGYIAQAERRYADAATHLRQAADAAGRLG
jgi:hypothetical protein